MGTQLKNPKKKLIQLNPNWAQLQQKINSSKPKSSAASIRSENPKTVLGKRKERYDREVYDDDDDEEDGDDSDDGNEGGDSRSSILIPTSNDFSVTDEIAMDCEMVGVGVSQGNKSALGRATLVNKWGNVIYDEFVRPIERVVDFRTDISGIRPRDLKKAKDFPTVQKQVAELIKGKILVGHALRNDLKALFLSHPKKDIRDTAEYQPYLKDKKRKALRHLASEFLGVEIQNGEHCPVEDARAVMMLYQKRKREWEKSVKDEAKFRLKQKKRKPRKKSKVALTPAP